MPSPAQLDRLHDSLGSLEVPSPAQSARSCTFDGAWRCECVQSDGGSLAVAGPEVFEGVRVELDGVSFWARRYHPEAARFEQLLVVRAGEAVLIEGATLVDGRWQLEDLTFGRDPRMPAECSRLDPSGATDRATEQEPNLDSRATAASATETAEGFELDDYAVGLLPVGHVAPGEPDSGILPPSIRATGDAVELEAAAFLAPYGALTATAAPGQWYGAGATLFTDGALALQGRWDTDEGFEPFAWGDFGVGSERQRVDGHVEHPALSRQADVRRLESDAFLRTWRRSSVGANLSGASYGFALDGAWVSRPDGTSDADIVAHFGGGTRLSPWVALDFDLDHRSTTVDDASSHSSTAVVSVSVPLGSRSKVWLVPGTGIYSNYGVIPAELGFEASASGGVVAHIDTGATWTGRFDGATHRISPRLRAGRELTGIAQRAPLPEEAPEYLFTRVAGETWGVLELENAVQWGSFTLDAPAGVLTRGASADELAELRPYAAPSVRWGVSRGELLVACRTDCDSAAWMASAGARLGRFGARLVLADASRDDLRLLSTARAYANPIHVILAGQSVGQRAQRWGAASASARWGAVSVQATAASQGSSFDGITGGATWHLAPLGFAVSALGGHRPSDDAWSAFVGLRYGL